MRDSTLIKPIPIQYRRVIATYLCAWGVAMADGPSPFTVQNAQEKIKLIIEPVRGLNAELRTGLQKIEQTCSIVSKNKINESKQLIANNIEGKPTVFKTELNSAKQVAYDQNLQMQKRMESTRIKLSSLASNCEDPKSAGTQVCKDFRVNNEIFGKVAEASAYYYAEAIARMASYEKAYELENNGCTRVGFSTRLWSAEQEHLMPTLKNSVQLFGDLLN